jgi:hypothetical protein
MTDKPPISAWVQVKGGGLWGAGAILPSGDVRGLRIGIAARRLLLQLKPAQDLPLHYETYDEWHQIKKPVSGPDNKVIRRLLFSGLIWSVTRYDKGSDTSGFKCLALTPLGTAVMEVFGEDIKRGQRIRWSKWDIPSVACTEEKWKEYWGGTEHFEANESESRRMGVKPGYSRGDFGRGYGNSMEYLCVRIRQMDEIWGDVVLWSAVRRGWGWSQDVAD